MQTISVVIPVRNEGSKIRACIEGILSQSVPVNEIIVVDSGSTDGTLEILKEYDKVKVIEVSPATFNHGTTRNVGVDAATGDYCVLTVGDARAADNDWIKKMLDCFDSPNVAGVCGQQVVPHEKDKNPTQWFRPMSEPEIIKYSFTPEEFNLLSPDKKRAVCGWDDVTAMYRTDLKRQIPFQHTTFAEDALWAKDALLAGYTIVYNPAARVYHYHLEDAEFTFNRYFTVFYHFHKFFGYKPAPGGPSFMNNLRMAKTLVKENKISWTEKLKWWKYNMAINKASNKVVAVFNEAVEKGEAELDRMHQQLCGKPPIPKKS